jgi:hypothetical protein
VVPVTKRNGEGRDGIPESNILSLLLVAAIAEHGDNG